MTEKIAPAGNQPSDVQPSGQGETDGTAVGAERPGWKCGAGPHPTLACTGAKGHAVAGNRRAAKPEEVESPERDIVAPLTRDPVAIIDEAFAVADAEMKVIQAQLQQPLTKGQRKALRNDLRRLLTDMA